jgi:predicted Zn-dependent protease
MKIKEIFSGVTLIAFLSVFTYFGCSGGLNVYSTQDDIALGNKIKAEIAKNPNEYPVLNDATLKNYVQGIVNKIVSSPVIKNRVFSYEVTLIRDDKTVNAFCIPGGAMYVYTGLMKYIDDEATLAGIMGHEITHADHRHSTQQMTKQYGVETAAAILLGNNSSQWVQIATNIGSNLVFLRFSRDDETDADQNSFYALNSIPGKPWHPGAIKYFMKKTLQKTGRTSDLEKLFLTHPPSEDRLAAIEALEKKEKLPPATDATLNRANYQRYRAMLP